MDADLDNVDLRVRAYVLRSHHREDLSPPLLVAAANVSGEPHLLSPFMNPFATHRGNEIGWCIVACWAMMLLVRLEPKGWRGFPFALAALAAFASSRATGATTTWPVRAQRVWANRVNGAALFAAVFALVHLVAYYFRPPPWTIEWSVQGRQWACRSVGVSVARRRRRTSSACPRTRTNQTTRAARTRREHTRRTPRTAAAAAPPPPPRT